MRTRAHDAFARLGKLCDPRGCCDWSRERSEVQRYTGPPETARQSGVQNPYLCGPHSQGDKPTDLPVQQMVRVEMILNLKTAKALGVTFPITLLGRADEVIVQRIQFREAVRKSGGL